jgi:hypothetical protein
VAAVTLEIVINTTPGGRFEQRGVVAIVAEMLDGRFSVRAYREPGYHENASHDGSLMCFLS